MCLGISAVILLKQAFEACAVYIRVRATFLGRLSRLFLLEISAIRSKPVWECWVVWDCLGLGCGMSLRITYRILLRVGSEAVGPCLRLDRLQASCLLWLGHSRLHAALGNPGLISKSSQLRMHRFMAARRFPAKGCTVHRPLTFRSHSLLFLTGDQAWHWLSDGLYFICQGHPFYHQDPYA